MRVAINAVALILTTAICSAAQGQNVYYVDDDALPGGDGLSWGTAFNYLQDALATSLPGDTIKIAEGNYRPDLGNGQSFGDNESSFLVPGGVSLLGGYAGALGMDPDSLNPDEYVVRLVGDLFEDDDHTFGSSIENTRTMLALVDGPGPVLVQNVQILSCNDRAIESFDVDLHLDGVYVNAGVILTAGNSSLFLTNCHFDSSAEDEFTRCEAKINYGNGDASNSLVIQSCLFHRISCPIFSGFSAVSSRSPGAVTIRDCIFTENSGTSLELVLSGADIVPSQPIIIERCEFRANSSSAIYLQDHESREIFVLSSIFNGNSSYGGSVINAASSTAGQRLAIASCTFVGNTGGEPAVRINQGTGASTHITSSIVWMNFPSFVADDIPGNHLAVGYSLLPAYNGGIGNINTPPDLVSLLGLDGMAGTGDEDFRLMPGSPCIDAGNTDAAYDAGITCDFDGNPRFYDDPATLDTGISSNDYPVTDMGAFEYRDQGPLPCPTDLNGDCLNDTGDLGLLIANFGTTNPVSDINGDGITDTADLGQLVAMFGQVCP